VTIFELGALGEFIGAMLLFASLVYVGIQIRQSNKTDRLNATIAFENQYRENVALWASSTDVAAIMAKGVEGKDELEVAEVHMFGPRMYALYRLGETAYEQSRQNLLDESALIKTLGIIAIYHHSKGAQAWYESHGRLMLSLEFCTFLDAHFRDSGPSKHSV
jgi:hypothetical protein